MPIPITLNIGENDVKTEVATERELLEFANKVRQAGGADPIPALLPAIPNDSNACLIARSLNFESEVTGVGEKHLDGSYIWHLVTKEPEATMIASKLDLEHAPYGTSGIRGKVTLPKHIGNAASAFDQGLMYKEFVDLYEN